MSISTAKTSTDYGKFEQVQFAVKPQCEAGTT